MTAAVQTTPATPETRDVLIVGAGFAGLYMLHAARGLGLDAHVLESADGIGGTWWHNRYPGARCDVESVDYSYAFDPRLRRWRWTERYPAADEIRRYLEFVADELDLLPHIALGTTVVAAHYDETGGLWRVRTAAGTEHRARFLVFATGPLSAARIPDLPGAERFTGRALHTADWPTDGVDVQGKTVAVLGTGSSGVQAIPVLAAQARELLVLQRTPGFVVPARNRPLPTAESDEIEADYPARRAELRASYGGWLLPRPTAAAFEVTAEQRRAEYERRWRIGGLCLQNAFTDVMTDPQANEATAEFVRDKIRETVDDPATAEALSPRGYPFGARRLAVGTDYYETFNRDNVRLVDLAATPLVTLTESSVVTTDREYPIDVLVYATGYDAMTGALARIDVRGRGGRSLAREWEAGPHTYLGLTVADFPNMFILAGPGSPSVMSNVVVSIEQHVEWVRDLLAHLTATGAAAVEADPAAQDDWVEHVNALAAPSMYMQADSWYLGANVPGKPRVFMPYLGGVAGYRAVCDQVAADGYRGLHITPAPAR